MGIYFIVSEHVVAYMDLIYRGRMHGAFHLLTY